MGKNTLQPVGLSATPCKEQKAKGHDSLLTFSTPMLPTRFVRTVPGSGDPRRPFKSSCAESDEFPCARLQCRFLFFYRIAALTLDLSKFSRSAK